MDRPTVIRARLARAMRVGEPPTRYWLGFARQIRAETAAREYERGLREGYLLAIADLKAFQHGAVRDAELERHRWHLCRRCRLQGHRDGCRDCQDRTRATFGDPFPGDYMAARSDGSSRPDSGQSGEPRAVLLRPAARRASRRAGSDLRRVPQPAQRLLVRAGQGFRGSAR
ncbi:MAG: hypothetical protein ACRDOL_05755 [Streptosporangiaceae bacterium]